MFRLVTRTGLTLARALLLVCKFLREVESADVTTAAAAKRVTNNMKFTGIRLELFSAAPQPAQVEQVVLVRKEAGCSVVATLYHMLWVTCQVDARTTGACFICSSSDLI